MARCDEGYLCRVCKQDVARLTDSDLYLRYVIGWVDPETLHKVPDCHLRCNPTLSQFITDQRFDPPVVVEGLFSKVAMDVQFAEEQTALINRGYDRLWEIETSETPVPVTEYPLPEFLSRWCG